MKNSIIILFYALAITACAQEQHDESIPMSSEEKVEKTDAEWQKELTPEEYRVLREKGTELQGTGEYNKFFKDGTYTCAGCGTALFSSETKYDSGSGWPAFYDAINKTNVQEISDNSLGMTRIEVTCNTCDGHLGHVFDDGPNPTGLRYCVNSVSLDFIPDNN